jgi:hypothetical protein
MVSYADLWLEHSHVARLLDGARLELRGLKARSTLLVPALVARCLDLKHKHDHSSRYTVLSPPCEACASLKGKLVHATKENTELQ